MIDLKFTNTLPDPDNHSFFKKTHEEAKYPSRYPRFAWLRGWMQRIQKWI